MPLKHEGVGFLIKAVAILHFICYGASRIIMDKKEFSMHMMKSAAC